jgi:adenylate cyclase
MEASPEILARHFTEGSVPSSAIIYWQRAGEMCASASANVEAAHHFQQALELLLLQPTTTERDAQELQLRVASGGPLLITKGHGSPEVEATYTRARELSEALGDASHLIPSLFGLWRHFVGRGDCHASLDWGRQLLELSERSGNVPGQVLGHYALGYTLFCRGALEESLTHLETGAKLYDPSLRDALGFRLGQDPGVACLSYGALTLWALGHPDAAMRRSQEAIELADALAHPFSRAYALSLAAQVAQLRGDAEATMALSERAIAISREQGFAVWLASPTIFRGWARAKAGELESGIEEMRNGIDAIRSAGMEMRRPLYLGLLIEGNIAAGRALEARELVDEAMSVISALGERWSESEQLRLAGDLCVDGDPGGAEAKFNAALEISGGQGARAWQLRAAVSLARLWSTHGRTSEAVHLLRPIYDSFSEGFETTDLRLAKSLLLEPS